METAIIFNQSELRTLIADTVNACLADWQPQPTQQPLYDGLSPTQAIDHLTSEGYPVAMATLYKLVHQRTIPFSKRGKRLVFSRKELTNWLQEGKVRTNGERLEDAENYIASNKKGVSHG